MAISRITRLREFGVFRDFTWTDDLHDFARFNLIYGWNGSGKTTLSNLLRNLELRTTPTMGQATVRISGNDVRGDDFAQATLPVRVFNRDFVSESVFPVSGDVRPIFVVGKENVEKQKLVEGLKANRTVADAALGSARTGKQEADKAFDRFSVDRAKVIKDTLRSPGANQYNNYDKSSLQSRAKKMLADGDSATHRLAATDRDNLLAQHRSTPKPKVSEIRYTLPSPRSLADAVTELLSTTVVSAVIQSLKGDPPLAEWARRGLGLHRERAADHCLFCEQPLPPDRLAALEAHFSAEYEQFIRNLDEQMTKLDAIVKEASEVKLPNRAEFYDDLASEYDTQEQALRREIEVIRKSMATLKAALSAKKGQAFTTMSLDGPVPTVDGGVVNRVNEAIRKHNAACDDFESRIGTARDRLALDMIAESLDEFVELKGAAETAKTELTAASDELGRLTTEITRLEAEIIKHQKPAEELNDDLGKYLGHSELQLAIKDTGYSITRNGVPADRLSEGEMTALALLYFLKSLQDQGFDPAQGVVVLDDPVSSLDSNALFYAFGFIRDRTRNVAQLIILTHNFTFFRQVRNWFHHLKGQNKKDQSQRPGRFFMLECVRDQDQRRSSIRQLDPLLEAYESEYHYLFARVYRAAMATPAAHLEQNYMLPNLARRLLETFLAFRQPQLSGQLEKTLQSVQFDETKKIRILRFLHTHSHGDAVGEPEHDLSVLSESRAVVNDLMSLIQSQDDKHFSAMVQLATLQPEGGDGE